MRNFIKYLGKKLTGVVFQGSAGLHMSPRMLKVRHPNYFERSPERRFLSILC